MSKVANLTAVRNPLASVFKPAKPNKLIGTNLCYINSSKEREKPEKEKKIVPIVKDKDLEEDEEDLEADFIVCNYLMFLIVIG